MSCPSTPPSWWPSPRLALSAALAGLVGALAYKYRQLVGEVRRGESARLVWCPPSTRGLSSSRRLLSQQIADILASCPSLGRPAYVPPPFAAGVWTNLALYFVKQIIDKKISHPHWRESLYCPDGGEVSIDYADDKVTRLLSDEAPIVIFLHTVTGSLRETSHFLRTAAGRGWRSCVFNRRGHSGMPLRTGSFNIMGDVEDTKRQVERVRSRYPLAYISMVGISAGSGLLVTYLGKCGDDTPVQAAACLCPAYDITEAFKVRLKYPKIDRHILASLKRLFINDNIEMLANVNSDALEACVKATSVHEFLSAHSPFAGFESSDQYYEENNISFKLTKVRRPVLLVNSDDDVVSLKENIREDSVLATGGVLLVRTKRGSHIAFNEGLLGTGCWLSRVSMDFLETAKNLHESLSIEFNDSGFSGTELLDNDTEI